MPKLLNLQPNSSTIGVPSAYRINYITLQNFKGRKMDIQAVVTDFSISESIYSAALLLEMNIKDPVNLLEEFVLSGQETITISLSRTPIGSNVEDTITKIFSVTEYPLYGKFSNRTQVYKLRGISSHAFVSKMTRLTTFWEGKADDFIYSVLTQDLSIDPATIVHDTTKSTANIHFNIPYLTPLDAISWILRRSFDQTGSPWYCYETLKNGIVISPQSSLVQKDPYHTYEDGRIFTEEPFTPEDFEQRRSRILSIASNLNLSKYLCSQNGAWASTSTYVDVANKTLSSTTFDYLKAFSKMVWTDGAKPSLSPNFMVGTDPLNKHNTTVTNYVPTNSLAYDAGDINYHSPSENGNINLHMSYQENLDQITNDITINGDFSFSAGNIIRLNLQKAVDPNVKVKNQQNTNSGDTYDALLSGFYLVTAVVHNFAEEYTISSRINSDSSNISFA